MSTIKTAALASRQQGDYERHVGKLNAVGTLREEFTNQPLNGFICKLQQQEGTNLSPNTPLAIVLEFCVFDYFLIKSFKTSKEDKWN